MNAHRIFVEFIEGPPVQEIGALASPSSAIDPPSTEQQWEEKCDESLDWIDL